MNKQNFLLMEAGPGPFRPVVQASGGLPPAPGEGVIDTPKMELNCSDQMLKFKENKSPELRIGGMNVSVDIQINSGKILTVGSNIVVNIARNSGIVENRGYKNSIKINLQALTGQTNDLGMSSCILVMDNEHIPPIPAPAPIPRIRPDEPPHQFWHRRFHEVERHEEDDLNLQRILEEAAQLNGQARAPIPFERREHAMHNDDFLNRGHDRVQIPNERNDFVPRPAPKQNAMSSMIPITNDYVKDAGPKGPDLTGVKIPNLTDKQRAETGKKLERGIMSFMKEIVEFEKIEYTAAKKELSKRFKVELEHASKGKDNEYIDGGGSKNLPYCRVCGEYSGRSEKGRLNCYLDCPGIHTYHYNCIEPFMLHSAKCPCCRQTVCTMKLFTPTDPLRSNTEGKTSSINPL